MRVDVYGRYHLDVCREGDRWVAYRLGEGTRRRDDLAIPPELSEEEIPAFLEDLLHELSAPGRSLRRIE